MRILDLLKGKVPEEKLKLVPRSFDIIGSKEKAVAVLEIPKGLDKKKVAKAVMTVQKNVKAVLNKVSKRKGVHRTREYEFVLGDKNTEVLHREYGLFFRLDPRKVYFSPREGKERQRVANQVGSKENVLVLFSGVSPFAIAIAKKGAKVWAVEINKKAHEYAKENIGWNRVEDRVHLVLGDAKKVTREWVKENRKFNRILMPLPEKALEYLEIGLKLLEHGTLHLYTFASKEELKKTKSNLRKKGLKVNSFLVGSYGPGVDKYCLDIKR